MIAPRKPTPREQYLSSRNAAAVEIAKVIDDYQNGLLSDEEWAEIRADPTGPEILRQV